MALTAMGETSRGAVIESDRGGKCGGYFSPDREIETQRIKSLRGGLGSPGVCGHFGPVGRTALAFSPDLVLALSSLVTTGQPWA